MKKQMNLLIIAMFVFGILQIVIPIDESNVSAGTPDDAINGLQYVYGDWYVNGSQSYTNETIILNGNLTINSGGSLILRNVTLAVNCSTANGTYAIYVWGSLDISDYDNDPATTYDRSNLTDSPIDADDRSPGDYKTSLKAYSGASLSITNSIIQDYGYDGGIESYGIYTTYVNNVNIQNCTIENGFYGVYIDRGSNSRVNHNEIRYCDESAIYMWGDSYADVLNNNIHHCDKGAYIGKWYSIVANNYIHNNSNIYDPNEWYQVGLRIQSADYCRVFNNTLEYNGKNWYGYTFQVWGCDYLKVYNNTFKNGKPGAGYSALIESSIDLEMYNNTIMNNPYTGVYFTYLTGNAKVYNNRIINNSGNGIYLRYSNPPTNFLIKDNYLDKNGWGIRFRQMRAYTITNNIITNCTGYGIYIDDAEGGVFTNNTINASGPDIHLRDSFDIIDTVFDVLNCTFNASETDFGSAGPELRIYNYLHLTVTDEVTMVPGAVVEVRNNSDELKYTGVSDDNGRVNFIVVHNQTQTIDEDISYDPVNITAYLDVYTGYGEIEPVMNVSQTVNVHFYDDLPPLPPPFLTAVSNLTNVDLNWEPSLSPDTDHYLVYRNTTGGSWQLKYDSSSSPGKELWTNWTDYHAASDWASYRYYVTTVDMLPQESVSSNIARCGDWVVNSTKTVTDLTAPMNGSIIILSTGNLTLKNAKIEFNCNFDGEYGIEVLPDGKLWILDNDNNPQTTGDRSDIYAINFSFYFNMQGNEFVMKNSRLSKCGLNESLQYSYWDYEVKGPQVMTVGDPSTRGLYISNLALTIIIENNEFSDNFVSILIDGSIGASITGNTFSTNTFGIYLSNSMDNTIYDNTFSGHGGFPMYLLNSGNNMITYNDITNPSNTEAGIALNDDGCIINSFFYNDFSGGKFGILAFESGNDNNISYNNFSNQLRGIYLIYTHWTMILENKFENNSRDCYLLTSSFTTIKGGTSNLVSTGFYVTSSTNVVISDVVFENVSNIAIHTSSSNFMQITNVTMKSCFTGINIGGGFSISMKEITIEDSTTGIYLISDPGNAELIDSTIYLGTSTAIQMFNVDNFEITDCYLNATDYNFDLDSDAHVTLYNTTFDQSKITLDSSSSISIWWRVDVRVFHWLGTPQQSVQVQIRNVAGTLIHTGWTDVNGYIGWIWMHERIQFSTSKESYTPHSFHAIWGNHAGSNSLKLNQSTLVTVWLENLPPQVSNVQISPTSPTTVDDLDLSYLYTDDESDPEGSTQILWYTDGVHNTTLNDQITISSSITSKDQTWFCEVIPHDGTMYGIPMISSPVTIQNTPPEVTGVSIDEASPRSSDNLHVSYTFSDIDGDSEAQSQYRWYVDEGAGFVYSGVDSLELASSFTKKGDLWKCIVTPNDGDDMGISEESQVVTIGNSAPEVFDVTIDPSSPQSNESLSVSYTYFDLDSDSESGSTISWYKNGTLQGGLNNNPQVDFSLTQKGEVWYYIVTPSDGEDFGTAIQSDSVMIGNTPPSVSNIIITPSNPTAEDDLNASYDFFDNDGDSESLDTIIRWLRWNGIEYFDTGFRGKTLPSELTSKGENWTCEVIPHDGWDEGISTRSDMNVTIVNSPPTVLGAEVKPSDPTSDTNLEVEYQYNDVDFDLESGSLIRWYKNSILQEALNDSIIVDSSLTLKGEIWHYIVTPSDGEDYGSPFVSESKTIGNTPPYVMNIVISPINPDTGDDLSVSYDFFDSDGDSESLDTVVKWLRWSGSDFFDTGLRGRNLSTEHTLKGEMWTCEVIPHDGTGEGAVNRSDMNVTINNSAPSVLNANIIPPEPAADSILIADYIFEDPDFDSESGSTIRWYKDGVLQEDLNDSFSVDYTLTAGNDLWYYIITPSDGEATGDPVQSITVTIGNTPPKVFNITISPSNPDTEDDLTVTYDYYDFDGDSESLDTVIRWLRWSGGVFFDTGLRGQTLPADYTSKGEIWICEVIPHDGQEAGEANQTETNVSIINSQPSVSNVYITPSEPAADSNLIADYLFIDPDFDSESGSTIRWYKDGVLQEILNDSFSVDYTLTQGNDQWYYVITPSDGEATGDPVQSVTVTIGNTPPKVFNVTISPSNPDTEDDLTVTYDYYDFDGDSESLDTVIRWLRWSGSVFFDTGLRGQTLPSVYTSKGEIWICEVIPHDGMEAGEPNQTETNVSILNSQPSVINVYVTPSSPTADSDLMVDYEFVDPDLESESGSIIRWYKNGVEQGVLNDSTTVDHSLTEGNDQWYYIITPSDGEELGSPVQSDTVVIGNTPPYVLNITISPLNPDTEADLTVSYEFYDSDGDSESLDTTVKWLRWGGSDFFDTGYRGKILSSDHTSRAEVWTCEVIPHDGVDEGIATRSDMNVTIVNTEPRVINVYVIPSEPAADSDLLADYEFIDPDFDSESGSKIRWYKDDVEQWSLNDSISVSYLLTTGNDQWYYFITPSDGEDFGIPVQSDTVVVGNTPPDVLNVTITPSDPDTNNDLTVTYDFFDYDGDNESLDTTIRWLLWNGILFLDTGLRGKTLSSDYTSEGDVWICEVIPHDGVDEGNATRPDMNVSIGNTKPSVSNAIITPSSPTADSDLDADYDYSDPDNDPESGSTISWFRNDVEQVDLYGFFTVNHSRTLKGDIWYYIVTPSDSDVFGDAVESENITIGNTPPQVSNVVISPSDATALDDLIVAYDFYDSDGDSEGLDTVIRWMRWSGSDFVDTGLRGKTLSAGHTSRAEIWICEVRPHDGISEGTTVGSTNQIIIANSPPTAQNAHITPDAPSTESDLIANYDYLDLDSDLEAGTEIYWFRDGVIVPELNNSFTVTFNYTQRGEVWNFTVRPSDGTNFGDDVDSDIITIENSPPYAIDLTILPNPPLGDNDLEASFTYMDEDGDSQEDYEITWYESITARVNGSKVESQHTAKDQLWYFVLRVFDGEDWSENMTSHTVVVQNSQPIIDYFEPTTMQLSINETESKDFFVEASDPDGDFLLIKWKLNKVTVEDDGDYRFETDYESNGTYTLNLTVQDIGENSRPLYREWAIVVRNVNRNPQIGGQQPLERQLSMDEDTSLKFSIEESDPDSEDILHVTWYVDDVEAQSEGSSYTYHPTFTAAGDHEVKAVVSDGTDTTEYNWSVAVADVAETEAGEERIMGLNWDQWGIILEIFVIAGTGLLAFIGYRRISKKKGALKIYMAEIDEISAHKDEDPIGYENRLNDLEARINDEFRQGHIEDLHYLMLQEIITSQRGGIRKAAISQRFEGLPEGVTKELDEMLKDGKISHAEYQEFVATMSQTTTLTPYQRKELSRMIGEWEVEDKDSIPKDSQSEKVKPLGEEEDELDELMNSLNGE
jgi:parallel beta-helix repeat protein